MKSSLHRPRKASRVEHVWWVGLRLMNSFKSLVWMPRNALDPRILSFIQISILQVLKLTRYLLRRIRAIWFRTTIHRIWFRFLGTVIKPNPFFIPSLGGSPNMNYPGSKPGPNNSTIYGQVVGSFVWSGETPWTEMSRNIDSIWRTKPVARDFCTLLRLSAKYQPDCRFQGDEEQKCQSFQGRRILRDRCTYLSFFFHRDLWEAFVLSSRVIFSSCKDPQAQNVILILYYWMLLM